MAGVFIVPYERVPSYETCILVPVFKSVQKVHGLVRRCFIGSLVGNSIYLSILETVLLQCNENSGITILMMMVGVNWR